MKRFFIRFMSFVWFAIGGLALIAWLIQSSEEMGNVVVSYVPTISILMVVSGFGALLLKRWGCSLLLFTAALYVVSSSFVWQLVHFKIAIDKIPELSLPIIYLLVYSLRAVRLEFAGRKQNAVISSENNYGNSSSFSSEYQEFVKRAKNGEILIGVESAVARKFFTDTDHSVIKEKIGESLSRERFLVKTCWLLEFVWLLAGIIASIFALKWHSIIAIPGMLITSFVLGGKASMGRQKIEGAVFLVVICFLLAYYFRDKGVSMIVWLVLLPLPYFFARLTYKLATMFLRSLSVRNEKAFNLLYYKGIFLKEQ